MSEPYTQREIQEISEEVKNMREEMKRHTATINEYIRQDGIAHQKMIDAVDRHERDIKENTNFRRRAMNAIVGAAFLALSAVGLAVLKITGVLQLPK